MSLYRLRYSLTAAMLLALGCHAPPPSRPALIDGQVPSSLVMRPAVSPPENWTPPIRQVVYRRPRIARQRRTEKPTEPQLIAAWTPLPSPKPTMPSCGAAADHQWLVGQLIYDAQRDRWLVRYAGPESKDPFGGELELLRTGPMDGFRSGQLVRVEGELVDPAPFQIVPAYCVRSLNRVPGSP